jgi:hypothetical protein
MIRQRRQMTPKTKIERCFPITEFLNLWRFLACLADVSSVAAEPLWAIRG